MELRLHLHSCFSKIKCCLIPHPGKKAATCQDFDGRLSGQSRFKYIGVKNSKKSFFPRSLSNKSNQIKASSLIDKSVSQSFIDPSSKTDIKAALQLHFHKSSL